MSFAHRTTASLVHAPPSEAFARFVAAWSALHGGPPVGCEVLVEQGIVALVDGTCRAERLRQAAIAELQKHDLLKTCAVLAAARVRHVVMKGLPLGQELYGGVALRFSGDIDLLVAREELGAAVDALAAAGYRHEPSSYTRGSVECFVAPGHGTSVELHADLSTAEGFRELASTLLERPRALALGANGLVTVPDRGAHLAYLLIHLARHVDAPRAIWVEDIRRLAGDLGSEDSARLVAVCRSTQVATAVHVGVALVRACGRLVSVPAIPEDVAAQLDGLCPYPARTLARWLVPQVVAHGSDSTRRRAYSLLLSPGWPARMGSAWRAIWRRLSS